MKLFKEQRILRLFLSYIRRGKATGPDGLSIELIEALEEYGIEKVTTLLNEIYDIGQIPVDMSRSIHIYSTIKETRSYRLRTSPNHQPHEPRYKAAFKNHHDESKKQNKSRNSRRTIRFCGRKRIN